jgi:hypothetical protein
MQWNFIEVVVIVNRGRAIEIYGDSWCHSIDVQDWKWLVIGRHIDVNIAVPNQRGKIGIG